MAKAQTAPSPKKELEQVKVAAQKRSLRERMEGELERQQDRFKRAKAVAKTHGDRVMGGLEVVGGGLIAGALDGAYPDAYLGPIDARKGFALGLAGVAFFTGGKGVGAHALHFAEGAAASIASDWGKGMGAKWREGRGSGSSDATSTTTAANASNANTATRGEERGDAVSRLRQVVMSKANERQPERRAGRGIPGRRANG